MQNFNEKALAVTAEVSKAVLGKPEVVLKIMMAMLARGHVLIEDIPGVGKTTLALHCIAEAQRQFGDSLQLTQIQRDSKRRLFVEICVDLWLI